MLHHSRRTQATFETLNTTQIISLKEDTQTQVYSNVLDGHHFTIIIRKVIALNLR